MKRLILTFMAALVITGVSFGQKDAGKITDSRDGKTYNTVDIEIKLEAGITIVRTWMSDNLNYESENSYCYKGEPAYCSVFGRLYNYEDALSTCIEGWHLSTSKEWEEVYNSFGGRFEAGKAFRVGGESNLNVKMGGFGDPGEVYNDAGISANFWDAESRTARTAGLITIHQTVNEVFHVPIGNEHRNSVRCVKDY